MSIDPISGSSSSGASDIAQATSSVPQQTLDANDFLKLLTVQLSNQNPLEPMEDTEFISQMSTFSSLEQMKQLNETMSQFSDEQRIVNAQNMLGKTVTYEAVEGQEQSMTVSSITLENGKLYLHGDDQKVDASQVTGAYLPDTQDQP